MGTADLYDKYMNELFIAHPIFRNFGEKKVFGGEIVTVKVFEDNVLVKNLLGENGKGKARIIYHPHDAKQSFQVKHRIDKH